MRILRNLFAAATLAAVSGMSIVAAGSPSMAIADEYFRLARATTPVDLRGSRRRSRGTQARPQRRSNRLTISKRTRRKHRRAA